MSKQTKQLKKQSNNKFYYPLMNNNLFLFTEPLYKSILVDLMKEHDKEARKRILNITSVEQEQVYTHIIDNQNNYNTYISNVVKLMDYKTLHNMAQDTIGYQIEDKQTSYFKNNLSSTVFAKYQIEKLIESGFNQQQHLNLRNYESKSLLETITTTFNLLHQNVLLESMCNGYDVMYWSDIRHQLLLNHNKHDYWKDSDSDSEDDYY
jgi:hypothetical protein